MLHFSSCFYANASSAPCRCSDFVSSQTVWLVLHCIEWLLSFLLISFFSSFVLFFAHLNGECACSFARITETFLSFRLEYFLNKVVFSFANLPFLWWFFFLAPLFESKQNNDKNHIQNSKKTNNEITAHWEEHREWDNCSRPGNFEFIDKTGN